MLTLTFQELFEYLEKGEEDPYIERMLERDSGAKRRLRQARRLYAFLHSEDAEHDSGADVFMDVAFNEEPLAYLSDVSEPMSYLGAELLQKRVDESSDEDTDTKANDHAIHQAERVMQSAGRQLLVAGTLLLNTTSPGGATLNYRAHKPPMPLRTGKDFALRSAASRVSLRPAAAFINKPDPIGDLGWGVKMPATGRSERTTQPSDLTRIRAGRLYVQCYVDPDGHELVIDIRNTESRSPERQLDILYVPQKGEMLRTSTDLNGHATMPLPAASGRLRLESTPAVAIDVEIIK